MTVTRRVDAAAALISEPPATHQHVPVAVARGRVAPLVGPALSAAVAAAGTAYIVIKNPHVPGATFVCPIFALTGMYCPGCGGTRAVYELAHGDVLGALAMNPLVTLAIPVIALLWTRWLLRGQGARLRDWPFPVWLAYALPAVIVAFAVLRNTATFAPYLAP